MLRISLNCPPCCRCGGSLVNSWYVVTAGHCVARARASQVRVTLGEYVLKSDVEPLPGRTYGASLIKVHPYFKFTPQADRSVSRPLGKMSANIQSRSKRR